jgi:hypothetical protein
MKFLLPAFLFSLTIGSLAQAGAAFTLYTTPARPELRVCQDKFGMSLLLQSGGSHEMTRITLDLYESADGSLKVERHARGYGLDLIDEQGQRHLLTKSGGGFGSCGE